MYMQVRINTQKRQIPLIASYHELLFTIEKFHETNQLI